MEKSSEGCGLSEDLSKEQLYDKEAVKYIQFSDDEDHDSDDSDGSQGGFNTISSTISNQTSTTVSTQIGSAQRGSNVDHHQNNAHHNSNGSNRHQEAANTGRFPPLRGFLKP